MLSGPPWPGWGRLREQCGCRLGRELLQRDHRLVPVLPDLLPADLPPLVHLSPPHLQHHRQGVRPLQRDPVLLVQENSGQLRQHWQVLA